jgi:hypothetical protein
MPEKY